MNLKEYINSNLDKSQLDPLYKCRLARFNKIIALIEKKYSTNKTYLHFIKYYLSIDPSFGVDLIIIFVCIISYKSKILEQKVEIIDDIVMMMYEEDIYIERYPILLKIFLLPVVVNWLDVFHALKNTRAMNFEVNILLSSLLLINLNQNLDKLSEEINKRFYAIFDIWNPNKENRWFDKTTNINEIYSLVLNKMDYIDSILSLSGLVVFTDEREKLQNLKVLAYLNEEEYSRLLNEILRIDQLKMSDINKIFQILNIIPTTVLKQSQPCKIIPFRRSVKDENR